MFELLNCPIAVPPENMSAIVRTESSGNPFAIGVVGHYLSRQPRTLEEAQQMVFELSQGRYNYSVGIAQVNQSNFSAYGLHAENMFDACSNLKAGSEILQKCYQVHKDWHKAYSCYYSGNAETGFKHGYVDKVITQAKKPILTSLVVSTDDSFSSKISIVANNKGEPIADNKPSLSHRRLASSLTSLHLN